MTATAPTNGATSVPITTSVITASLSEPIAALAGGNFTVTCSAPCTSPNGTATLNAAGNLATFTLASGTTLMPITEYTATISGVTSAVTGFGLQAPYVWRFTTGSVADVPPLPAVTAVAPLDGATSVAVNNTVITAAFSEPMDPLAEGDFTVTCSAPCTSPDGTATLNTAGTIATFTLAAGTELDPITEYTGTISGVTSRATGFGLLQPYVWRFTTRVAPDTTRPRVTVTQPVTTTPGPTGGVPTNTAISAVFSEDMAPASIDEASFTLTCAAPCVAPGTTVSYAVGSRTAVLTPAAVLDAGETYTATVTTTATDIALNALAGNQAALPDASDYVWRFTTAAAVPAGNVSVFSTEPVNAGTICPTDAVNATFTVPSGLRMDPNSITAATFTVTGPAPLLAPVVAATVSLDVPTGTIATFVPLNDLTVGDTYTAVVEGGATGVMDLAVPANTMLNDFSWTFTVAPATGACLQPVALNTVEPFGVFGGSAGMTNTGIQTVIDGDIGTISTTTSTVRGFHDTGGDVYTETLANIGAVNGLIYTCTNSTTGPTSAAANPVSCDIATIARLDAEVAYLELAGLPGGPDPGAGNLANLTLAPGVYTASLGSFMIEGGDLTLDAQGDANAVWVFQMATTLTVGGPGAAFPQSIVLTNGALAKNVFWQVGSAATINAAGGGTMVGTIISQAGVAFSTVGNTDITTLNGRALSLGASVTLVDTIINVPSN
ncbi:MAG: ice-binding family protein [Gammaproteobacteria bacterium]